MKLFLNCQDNDITFNKKNYLLRAAKRLGFDWVKDIKEKGIDEEAECVLNIEPYNPHIIGTKWTGIWEIDLMANRPELNMSDWVASNNVFLANSVYSERTLPLKHLTQILFQACDPELHKPIETSEKYDYVLCGTSGSDIYGERSRLHDLLKKEFTYKDFGKGFKPEEYVKNINHARVQFMRSANTQIVNSYIAQRFFECLAIGPVLTNYHSDLKLLGLIEGQDYFSYKTDEELLQKMHKLINEPEFAKQMAQEGRKKALMFHTYAHRLISIINTIYETTGFPITPQ